jgi:hypothetical protein
MTIVGFWVYRSNHINSPHREGPWRYQVNRGAGGALIFTVYLALMTFLDIVDAILL